MSEQAARILRRMRSVPEVGMRIALWREQFERPVEETLEVIEAVLDALDQRSGGAHEGYLALLQFVERPSHGLAVAELLAVAVESASQRVVELVSGAQAARSPEVAELRSAPIEKDRDVTLGERRSMARSSSRERLDRLLFDLDPMVIKYLLSNPRIVEQDVTRIAARRPASAEILRSVFRHPRWGRAREVQLALAQNPYAPTDVAAGLLGVLDRAAMITLSQEPSVHPTVRARAEALLNRREQSLEPTESPTDIVWEIELDE